MIAAIIVGLTLFSTTYGHPGVHRVTGQYVTRTHRVTGAQVNVDTGVGEVTGQEVVKVDSLYNEGDSFMGDAGVNRRNICNRGVVDKTATAIRETVNAGVSGLAEAISGLTGNGKMGIVGEAVDSVGHIARDLVTNGLEGVDFAIQDAACGLGNIANEIAHGLDTGNILGAVGGAGRELVGGVANIAQDLVSEAGEGLGAAANDLLGFLGLGK